MKTNSISCSWSHGCNSTVPKNYWNVDSVTAQSCLKNVGCTRAGHYLVNIVCMCGASHDYLQALCAILPSVELQLATRVKHIYLLRWRQPRRLFKNKSATFQAEFASKNTNGKVQPLLNPSMHVERFVPWWCSFPTFLWILSPPIIVILAFGMRAWAWSWFPLLPVLVSSGLPLPDWITSDWVRVAILTREAYWFKRLRGETN